MGLLSHRLLSHGRRVSRALRVAEDQVREQAARRAEIESAATGNDGAGLSLEDLHATLAIEAKAAQVLVAFAREVAGISRHSNVEVPASYADGGVSSEAHSSNSSPPLRGEARRGGYEGSPNPEEMETCRPASKPAEAHPVKSPPRVQFVERPTGMIAIDTITGRLADSATALAAVMEKSQ